MRDTTDSPTKLGAASGQFRPLTGKGHMKWLCPLLFLPLALCLTAIGYGQTAPTPTPLPSVKEGVYFFQNMYSTTVLELKGGNFRYWFKSDVLMRNPPNYPVVGKYQANGGAVTLPHKDIYETNWTSMTYDGKVTLWRPSAVKYWEESKKIDAYGVLFPTDRKPESIWGGSNGNPSHSN